MRFEGASTWLSLIAGTLVLGCDVVPFDRIRVHTDAVLYKSADDCHSSRVALATDVVPSGRFAIVVAGSTLEVTRQSASKEALCVRVKYRGQEGFLLVSTKTTEWVKQSR